MRNRSSQAFYRASHPRSFGSSSHMRLQPMWIPVAVAMQKQMVVLVSEQSVKTKNQNPSTMSVIVLTFTSDLEFHCPSTDEN